MRPGDKENIDHDHVSCLSVRLSLCVSVSENWDVRKNSVQEEEYSSSAFHFPSETSLVLLTWSIRWQGSGSDVTVRLIIDGSRLRLYGSICHFRSIHSWRPGSSDKESECWIIERSAFRQYILEMFCQDTICLFHYLTKAVSHKVIENLGCARC